MDTVFYQVKNGIIKMRYEGKHLEWFGYEMRFMFHTLKSAFKAFKEKIGIKRAHLEKVDWLIMWIY